jgi:cytosine/adenosine deaminase-related metal-dependent hydrolase
MSDEPQKPSEPSHAAAAESGAVSRRRFLEGSALAAVIGTLGGGLATAGLAAAPAHAQAGPQAAGRKMLLKGGTVLTLDPALHDLADGDVLIAGGKIAAVGVGLDAGDAEVIDAHGCIVMPGFVDTHRHLWEGIVRNSLPDATLLDYLQICLGKMGPVYRPEDVYAANLVSCISALDAGITTILDWSHIQNSPEHSDAAVKALQDSGIRAVFGYGAPQVGWGKKMSDDKRNRYPEDIRRLRKQYFSSDDQLVTLALAANGPSFGTLETAIQEWAIAREVGARITVHCGIGPKGGGKFEAMGRQGLLKADTTYIHCNYLTPTEWKMIADTGGTVSLASLVEMAMGHGVPAIQPALDAGLKPSLSVDVETSIPNELFTQMRTVFGVQRMDSFQRTYHGDKAAPKRITARDVLTYATINGAVANGLGRKTGSLTPGKAADVIMLRADRINVMPIKDPVAAVVFGMDTGNVDTVIVAGTVKKRGGRLVDIDFGHLAALAQASHHYVLEKSGLA